MATPKKRSSTAPAKRAAAAIRRSKRISKHTASVEAGASHAPKPSTPAEQAEEQHSIPDIISKMKAKLKPSRIGPQADRICVPDLITGPQEILKSWSSLSPSAEENGVKGVSEKYARPIRDHPRPLHQGEFRTPWTVYLDTYAQRQERSDALPPIPIMIACYHPEDSADHPSAIDPADTDDLLVQGARDLALYGVPQDPVTGTYSTDIFQHLQQSFRHNPIANTLIPGTQHTPERLGSLREWEFADWVPVSLAPRVCVSKNVEKRVRKGRTGGYAYTTKDALLDRDPVLRAPREIDGVRRSARVRAVERRGVSEESSRSECLAAVTMASPAKPTPSGKGFAAGTGVKRGFECLNEAASGPSKCLKPSLSSPAAVLHPPGPTPPPRSMALTPRPPALLCSPSRDCPPGQYNPGPTSGARTLPPRHSAVRSNKPSVRQDIRFSPFDPTSHTNKRKRDATSDMPETSPEETPKATAQPSQSASAPPAKRARTASTQRAPRYATHSLDREDVITCDPRGTSVLGVSVTERGTGTVTRFECPERLDLNRASGVRRANRWRREVFIYIDGAREEDETK